MPQPSADGGLQESINLGSPVPLAEQPDLPPSQGQLATGLRAQQRFAVVLALVAHGSDVSLVSGRREEPRLGTAWLSDSSLGPRHDTRLNTPFVGTVWDSTLGARVGILRYGTPNAYRPEGFQVDLTGSAQPRLNPYGASAPLLSCDYTIGIPVTYARGKWQYKTGYNHLSSHFGDEFLINNPTYLPLRSTTCAIRRCSASAAT